jgi:uncharacterized protein YndB with AHSA1/START domain
MARTATESRTTEVKSNSPAPASGTGIVRLHRVLRAPAERVYKAFLDPDALAKWMAPHGFTGKVHSMDARVGGGYKMSFTNFSTGSSHFFGGKYIELKPGELLRYTDKFDAPPNSPMSGEMQMTITLKKVMSPAGPGTGTALTIVQEGIPAAIPAEMCYLGWQESLNQLAQLVEPEIPDGA